MRIATVKHRGLKGLLEDVSTKGIRGDLVGRVRRILTALISAPDIEKLEGPPGWRVHQLTGDRAGTWSIATSGNWRITITDGEIHDLNLEDYH